MSTEKENAKNGAMEVEETSNDETRDTQASSDSKVSDESTGKSKEKDVKKKPKGKEPKKESKESDSNSVKEGKTGKGVKDDRSESEDEENEENDENEKSDGKVPLLDQPLELSGTRERKKVQRFSEEYKRELKDAGPVEIPKGRGARLGSIPRVDANLQRSKPDVLKPIHRILFNRVGKAASWKKNVCKFNGFDFDEDSDQYIKKKQTLLKFDIKVLRELCSVLDLKSPSKRDAIVETILKFLMKPEDSGKPVSKPRPKRAARANNKSYSESDDEEEEERKSSRRGAKKRANLKEISSEDDEDLNEDDKDEKKNKVEENDKDGGKSREKRERKGNDSDKDAKENDSDGGNVNDADDDDAKNEDGSSDDSEELKSKSKKGSRSTKNNKKQSVKKANSKKPSPKKPEKKPISKKRAKSDDESSEDEPLVKKTKAPPTDEEIKSYVKEILEGANLEETTMKIVCKQVYAHYPDFDLAHKKDFIKTTVKSLIST